MAFPLMMLLRMMWDAAETRLSSRMPTVLPTMVLFMIWGLLPTGRVRLMARAALLLKTLLEMMGEEPLIKETTPERNWLSAELLRKILPVMVGEALLPPMAAP